MNWYVLFVMGGKEHSICEFLNEKYQDWQAFYPEKEVIHKKQGQQIVVKKPMFPSYIFIESNVWQEDIQQRIKAVRVMKQGIIKELRYEAAPALEKDEIRYLTSLMDEDHVVKRSIGYIENDKVMITEGPLQGLESEIIKIDRHKRQAVLRIRLLNREMEVSVSLEIVKKIG